MGCSRSTMGKNTFHFASSGFNVDKCRVMADVGAPLDAVGTGSFLPDSWRETYATADIVEYDGVASVKVVSDVRAVSQLSPH